MLSDTDRDSAFAVDDTGLRCQARLEQKWAGGRATFGVTRGKYYYEAEVTDEGLCRVGWSSPAANRDLGNDTHGYGFGGTGKKSNSRKFDDYGRAYKKGDVVGCYLDADDGKIHFAINGEQFPTAFTLPAANKGRVPLFPAVVLKNAEMLFNFGATPFKFPPMAPFQPLVTAPVDHTSLAGTGTVAKGRKPLAIIIEPSRELAEQSHAAIVDYKKHLPTPTVEVGVFTGGTDTKPQVELLRNGVDVVVGTPGRLESLVAAGTLGLDNIRFFVLDEADRLLDTENFGLILKMYKQVAKSHPVQVLMFSATLHSPEIKELSEQICQFPTWVDLKGKDTIPTVRCVTLSFHFSSLWVGCALRRASFTHSLTALIHRLHGRRWSML
jgi:ATP-dependent RNA helicase DDX1